jgi:hypothetical protein
MFVSKWITKIPQSLNSEHPPEAFLPSFLHTNCQNAGDSKLIVVLKDHQETQPISLVFIPFSLVNHNLISNLYLSPFMTYVFITVPASLPLKSQRFIVKLVSSSNNFPCNPSCLIYVK